MKRGIRQAAKRGILRGLVGCAGAIGLLAAGDALAGNLEIPLSAVSARPAAFAPVRLAAADRVGRMVFARQYRATLDDALPGRMSIFAGEQRMPLEDWLREWGTVQIQEIGRPRL